MQLALAKTAQLRLSGRQRNFGASMKEGIARPSVSTDDILALKGIVLTLSEKLRMSNMTNGKGPTISREDERWVFGIRSAAIMEIKESNQILEPVDGDCAPLKKSARMEEVVKLANDAIIYSNQGMVYGIAIQVLAKMRGATKAGLEDLVNVGNEAMMRHAIGKFKPGLGFRFMTYAKRWVRRDIVDEANRWIAKVKTSRKLSYETTRAIAFMNNFVARNGRDPTDIQIANGAHISLERVKKYGLRDISAKLDVAERKPPKTMHELARDDQSLEERALMKVMLRYVLSNFPAMYAHYADLLRIRFGTDIGDERTYKEAAKIWKVSKQRVKQLEERALGILATRLRRQDIDSFF